MSDPTSKTTKKPLSQYALDAAAKHFAGPVRSSDTTDDRQKEIEAWSKALARAEDLAIERKKEIQRLQTDRDNLRGVLAEISAARTDSCLVHELVQQALGFDPDLEIKP